MATLGGRKDLIFWISAMALAVVLLVFLYLQVRGPRETRVAFHVTGDPEKGAARECGEEFARTASSFLS